MHLTTFKSDKKSGQFWSVDQYKKGCKGREIRKEVHIYDEYAKLLILIFNELNRL